MTICMFIDIVTQYMQLSTCLNDMLQVTTRVQQNRAGVEAIGKTGIDHQEDIKVHDRTKVNTRQLHFDHVTAVKM